MDPGLSKMITLAMICMMNNHNRTVSGIKNVKYILGILNKDKTIDSISSAPAGII